MEMEIEEIIRKRNETIIARLQKEIDCSHTWIEHGYGYFCTECQYYSGLDIKMNKLLDATVKKVASAK